MEAYKHWVKRHPSIVSAAEWLAPVLVWNPSRTHGGSEGMYEAANAAVGLLSLWHQHILDEALAPTQRPSTYLWLDALEQARLRECTLAPRISCADGR
jgi:hypothetical protein